MKNDDAVRRMEYFDEVLKRTLKEKRILQDKLDQIREYALKGGPSEQGIIQILDS